MPKINTLLLAFCAMLIVVISIPSLLLVQAQEVSTPDEGISGEFVLISLRPQDKEDGSRFEIELGPGETGELTAVLQNFDSEPIALSWRVGHLNPQINGGLSMAPPEESVEEPGSWIDFPADQAVFAPGEIQERLLTITVPAGTPPGQYVAAIELKTVEPVQVSGSFEQYFSKIVSVYITVPGDLIADFMVSEPEIIVNSRGAALVFTASNSGNVRLDLTGSVTLFDAEGNTLYEMQVPFGPLYLGQETFLQVILPAAPPPGEYSISYSFTDTTSAKTVTRESMAIEIQEGDVTASAPIRFENVAIEPNANPIVFANVTVEVTSTVSAYPSTRLTLSVHKDGSLVEDFVLSENLRLDTGTTVVTQRYLPSDAWEPGIYSFSLKLEAIDGDNASVLLDEKDIATLEVP